MDSPARWVPPGDVPGGWRAHTVNGTVGFTPGEGLAPSLQTPPSPCPHLGAPRAQLAQILPWTPAPPTSSKFSRQKSE